MRRYLLDSGIASHCINRRHGVYERVRAAIGRGDRVGVGTPILGELYGGVEASATRERNLARLRQSLNLFVIWPFDVAAAVAYGRVYAALRRLGRPIQQIDMQLAAIALSLGNCTVVSTDSDVSAVPGLDVENWAIP